MKPLIDCDSEIWKDVVGYGGVYAVSSSGKLYSYPRTEFVASKRTGGHHRFRNGGYITPRLSNTGYLQIGLHLGGKSKRVSVHRLVAQAFIENVDNLKEVNHLNGVKTDNRSVNLEWSSRVQNSLHSTQILNKNRGEGSSKSKLTKEQVLSIKSYLEQGLSQTEVARRYGVSNHAIFRIQHGYNWSWLTGYVKKGKDTSCDR